MLVSLLCLFCVFFFSSRRRHTRCYRDWSSDVCSSDLSAVPDLRLRVVDIAAGILIVREAGGLVLDLAGRDLDLPLDSSARTDLAAVGDRRVWEAIRCSSASPRITTSRAPWRPRTTSPPGSRPIMKPSSNPTSLARS